MIVQNWRESGIQETKISMKKGPILAKAYLNNNNLVRKVP